ncbi:nitroimidazol reductase NimA-like FMN-containing flavoprotein (pyridoxamine 5'-phosphate oxidase superfamily) [Paenibacillus forsythiae]|uniref:Nitroimidazol reductase NimA-like FMN-containing flavoprotein (Pyridoxamine 5'-phosphate oxidase superfamily) n=1 Tax=Paenibacillus forsythiae TaxID=365616 RepID=A0ABU3HEB4_9BACL|nr:pyridoxamine 5'-phosphate oxidase family protein [Paenibacillus forsythiae]MDT3429161.1 nitroimidazol reductase NimA-like FMN-containing flavoprotein (pyridoxamine 5'-phosphate oxidase superfamily) [Paenibacillus forsythiae]
MRRKEFKVENEEELTAFLDEMSFGFLGVTDGEGRPRVIPLNFVYTGGCFYFHGSHAGGKMEAIRKMDKVCFTVADEFALIPSYFTDPEMACPATSYFKSVTAFGTAEIVTDLGEKAAALDKFMHKLQPEGGYEPVDAENPKYRPALKAVAVVRIVPEELTAKFKFGQNLKEEDRSAVISGLEARGGERDAETVEMMKKFCPFHSS